MKTQNLIENYMSQLDQYLSHIPATEKAEIILELNSHIQDTLSSGNKTVEEVLSNLGTPEEAARKHLEERGLNFVAPRNSGGRSDTGKWLTITFLGTMGLLMVFSIFIMFFFSPLVEVREEEGRVRLLGGLINVQEDMSKNSKFSPMKEVVKVEGVEEVKDLKNLDEPKKIEVEVDLDDEDMTEAEKDIVQ